MRNLCLTAAIEELARVGIREPVVARGAKHPQLRWTTPRGELRVFAVAGDPERLASRHYAGPCAGRAARSRPSGRMGR